jgi:hypothetical protein
MEIAIEQGRRVQACHVRIELEMPELEWQWTRVWLAVCETDSE